MPDRPLPPVTVLSGFLGAGKTTLLNHLVTQAEGRRWALIVNDVGAINIDARLLAQQTATVAHAGGGQKIVELGNGCVCCSSKDDLAETIAQLAVEGGYDHLFVETTGVAEPRSIAALFLRRNSFGRCLGDVARLHALVTVIDAAHFLREHRRVGACLQAIPRMVETQDRLQAGSYRKAVSSPSRELFELLLEQAECADALIVNKCDLATEAELGELEAVLRGLNPRAELLRTEQGQVPSEWLLDRPRFDASATLGAAQWIRALNALAPKASLPCRAASPNAAAPFAAGFGDPALQRKPTAANATPDYTTKYGLRCCVFQARRPFAQERFHDLLARGLPGVVRAKGFYWLAERPDEMGFLSLAGDVLRHDWLSYWWAAKIENGKASLAERPPTIRALWQEPHGDRRQELVFIGVGLDEAALRRALEACLV